MYKVAITSLKVTHRLSLIAAIVLAVYFIYDQISFEIPATLMFLSFVPILIKAVLEDLQEEIYKDNFERSQQ